MAFQLPAHDCQCPTLKVEIPLSRAVGGSLTDLMILGAFHTSFHQQ